MIVTARQLADLHRTQGGNGQLTLPYRARLTPLAADFVRSRKIVLGYSDLEGPEAGKPTASGLAAPPEDSMNAAARSASPAEPPLTPAFDSGSKMAGAGFLWWCDGPCGPAKAAITSLSRESRLHPLDEPADPRRIVTVVRRMAVEVKAGRADGGILIVKSGAAAMVYANRCRSLRAVVGTCIDSVEQGLRLVAANVLVVEHPFATLQQSRNLVARFVRGPRIVSEEIRQNLAEVSSCV